MSKRYLLLLSFTIALFVFLYILLSYYSRLATDDYYFIWDVQTHGIFQSLRDQYMQWSGRFSVGFVADSVYYYLGHNQFYYFLYQLFSFILIICGCYFTLSAVAIHMKLPLSKAQRWIAAFFFVILLFFLSIDIGESWFWCCSSNCYLWSIIAFIWAVGFLLKKDHFTLSLTGAIICFIYIGGAGEFNSVVYGILMTVYLVCKYRETKTFNLFIKDPVTKKIVISYFVLGISFTALLIAPGNYLRDGLFPEHHFFYSFFIVAKSLVKFSVLYLPIRIPYIIVFSFPFVLLGATTHSTNPALFHVNFRRFFIRFTLYLAILLFVFFLLVAYVMVETGPPRVWFLVSFLLTVYFIVLAFYAGYCSIFNAKQMKYTRVISVAAGIIVLISWIIFQNGVAKNYAAACDNRIQYIKSLNNTLERDTIIKLQPLPYCGMLYSAEIKADTSHFTNKELRLGYNLKFHVVVENKEP